MQTALTTLPGSTSETTQLQMRPEQSNHCSVAGASYELAGIADMGSLVLQLLQYWTQPMLPLRMLTNTVLVACMTSIGTATFPESTMAAGFSKSGRAQPYWLAQAAMAQVCSLLQSCLPQMTPDW